MIFSNTCSDIDMYESILFLKNPKLLYDLTENSAKSLPIQIPSIINSSYSIKNEKKNKSNFKVSDTVENKKNKLKQKKKIRSKIYIDKGFSDNNEDIELNDVNVLPFLRPSKNLKSKKQNKNKVIAALSNNDVQNMTDIVSVQASNPLKHIYLENLLTVQELSERLSITSTQIIKWLFLQGIPVTINQILDVSISTLVAEHYDFVVLREKSEYSNVSVNHQKLSKGRSRSPVVTILGHVDHGKTTLLNVIRQNNKLNKEIGNITQAIGSYEVLLDDEQKTKKIIFLDTPGHQAFISIRRRGADITDLVILVVAADDGLKPQTIEAIEHIQKRDLPFIVAINKIDKVEANIDQIKKQLSRFNITSNNVPIVGVSALTGENIDTLLSNLIVLSEAQNLQSDPCGVVEGMILDAYLDKQRGPVAKLLIQNGTLAIGNVIITGNTYGKVKAIVNSIGSKVKTIESNALAEVLGFPSVPDVGLSFKVVNNEKEARVFVSNLTNVKPTLNSFNNRRGLDIIDSYGQKSILKQIKLIIKTDVQGTIDPIINALSQVSQDKVQVNIISIVVGSVSLKDIQLAYASSSIILVFNLNIPSAILGSAKSLGVVVKQFNVIYDLIDYIKKYMLTFVEVQYKKEIIGHAEVKSVFVINNGVVAGCFVLDGKLKKNNYLSITRNGKIVYSGLLSSLKRGKINVDEVLSGYECGLICQDYNMWEINDQIEAYINEPLEKSL